MAEKSKRQRRNLFNIEKSKRDLLQKKFRDAGSSDMAVAQAASAEIAEAIETPLRRVLLSGDIVNGIYTPVDFTGDNNRTEFPLDLLTPGQEREFFAYSIPDHGYIPERRVEADYLMVPTYSIGNAIDCTRRFVRDANWPVITRMIEVLEAGFIKKMNDDGWQTILAAGVDRNIRVNDPDASAGQFTPRLVTLMKTVMRRNGGGNSGTLGRSRLTDLFVSPESLDDVRDWGLDLIPDDVRARIFDASDESGDMLNVYGTTLHALDEFGEAQEYQNYYTNTLSGTLAAADAEIVVGLDLQREDSFVNPVREELSLFEDNTLHRQGLFGMYGFAEVGFAVLDSRRTLVGSL